MSLTLLAEVRDTAERATVKALRAARKIPAVVYGPDVTPRTISVESNPFEKAFHQAGESTLIELEIGAEKIPALVKSVQTHPVTNAFTHIDFFAVSMKKELETDVTLEFTGESDAVKHLGGTLVKIKDALTIRCLPKYLVRTIAVPLSKLATFDDMITVADVVAPEGITILDEPEEAVAKVSAPLTEDQLKAMEAENSADVSKVEVVGKKKEDEEAAAEGAEGAEKPAEAKK